MAARRVQKCYYDEEQESFHQECIIAVVNSLVGKPVLNDTNFEGTIIKSSNEGNAEFRYRFFLVLPDGSRHEIPLFYGIKYGNSSGRHVNSKRAAFSANFTPSHIELVKAIMRLGSMASSGYLSRLRGSASNYEGSAHFSGEQEELARRFENLQNEEAASGGGSAYHQALEAARAEAGQNAYMHNLSAAGANVRASARAGYESALEKAMRNYKGSLGPMTAAKAEGGASAGAATVPVVEVQMAINEEINAAAIAAQNTMRAAASALRKKYGGRRATKRRATKRKP